MKILYLEDMGKAFVPKKIRPHLRSYLLKAGITRVPYRLFGVLFYLSFLLTAAIFMGLVYPALVAKNVSMFVFTLTVFFYWVLTQLGIVLVIMVGIYIYLDQTILSRTKKMEAVLEDFLRYVSENLKGGMSFEKALWDAIRPKFGILAVEIRLAAKKVMTGQDVEQALMEFTDKYDSPMLKRTFSLIVEGMKGGHKVADLLDRIEVNIRETRELKEEIVATNSTYVIFLSIITLVIAPGLFGLSYNLLLILQSIGAGISTSGGITNLPINLGNMSVDPRMYRTFSIYAIAVTGFFGSLIVSIINKGNIKQGIKYIPIYVGISLVMYAIFRTLLTAIFSGIVA
ncbi:type II secretion system F family protein [Candidatus Woesearchaeota archaeon]|nr:type II secretion system F family protein [Candidatus Woesearchaeota archaeon]